MTGEKRGWRMPRAGLMRGAVIDIHQLGRHEVEIDVRALEPVAEAASRREGVEDRSTDEGRVDHESRHIAPGRGGAVAPYESCRLNQDERGILARIAGPEHGGVGGRQ